MDDATRAISALLAPLTNWERTRSDAPRFDLEAMRTLLAREGAAARPAPLVVQVGGSKGKGTTAAYLEALARTAGLTTGVYASPHVSTIRERVRLDGRPVDGHRFVRAVEGIVAWLTASGTSASAFEVLTAAAVDLFAASAVDLAVLEVGLGGRLDATTAIDVDASVLTSIELEHTEILGATVEAIAGEKAAILRPGRLGVSGVREPGARLVRERAADVGCRLVELGRELSAAWTGDPACRTVRIAWPGGVHEVRLLDAPAHEVQALALAFGTLQELGVEARPEELPRPALPARFELVPDREGRPIVLDGAHTARSAEALVAALEERFPGRRATVLFASARGKRWKDVLSPLLDVADSFVVTELSGTTSEDPETIRAWLAECGVRARAVPDAAAGLEVLREERRLSVVTGSFYLAGAVRDLLRPEQERG